MLLTYYVGFLFLVVLTPAWTNPSPYRDLEARSPHSVVSDLNQRLGVHPPRLQDPRLPLPTPQELEAIKKVAQILVMLGEQVIPVIIGESPPHGNTDPPAAVADDVPNDQVNDNQLSL